MRILYLLDRSAAEAEIFIRREIREAARQGIIFESAHPAGDGYRVESAAAVLGQAGAVSAETGADLARPLALSSTAAAMRHALSLSPPGALRASGHAMGAGRGQGSGFRLGVALALEARRFGADIIHAHFAARACEDAMMASWISGIPFTFTAHGYDIHREPPSDYAVRGRAAAAVVTVSRANASALAQRHGVPHSVIRVIPCGVDTDRFSPGGAGREEGLIASVLRLHPDKGPDILLRAASELMARGVVFRLEIIGDGDMRQELQRGLAGPLGSVVTLAGPADEDGVVRTLRRASLFVLPSRTEGWGIAAAEAMSCGRAVVASGVGGLPELLDSGRLGVLVPPEDPVALATAMAALLTDPARALSLGEAARAHIVAHHKLDRSVSALRSVWREAAMSGRRAAAARGGEAS